MGKQLYKNNATSTLAAGAGAAATALTLEAGGGDSFASPSSGDWQMITVTSGSVIEIMKMTARTGDVLTVVRAQESTTAAVWAIGAKVEARLTAAMLGRLAINMNTHGNGLALGRVTEGATQNEIALGQDAVANNAYGIAIGASCSTSTGGLVAIGSGSVSNATGAIAIGTSAKVDKVGGVAMGREGPRAYREYQYAGFFIPCIPRDEWKATRGAQFNSGQETAWAGQFVDLGTPQTWAASTVYTEGAVVRPSTPNGFQYRLYHGAFDSSAALNTVTSGATEPTWPVTIEGDVQAEATFTHYWIASDLSTGADELIPAGMVFYPTEVGFICFNHSGVTDAPFVSIGTVADPTLLVNNQQLTGITGAAQRHAFSGLKHGLTSLRCKLITPATGASARFHGRFYAKGIFIQSQG